MPHGSSAPTAPTELDTRTFTVTQLLDAIRKGRVRIPHFQRGYRWTDEDRRALFDSLQHGFPVGTLLLAQAPAPSDTLSLGGYSADLPPVADALWIVDGQQRVATLAMALLEDRTGTYRPIYFDLIESKFVLGVRRRAPPSHWVPTHVLVSSSVLNRWLREAEVEDELSDRADQIAARLREYKIPAYLVPFDGKDDSVLRQIFSRTNRSGRALDSHEVFDALHVSRQGEQKPTEHLQELLGPLAFGQLGGRLIERSAVAVAGGSPGRTLGEVVAAGRIDVKVLFDRVATSLAASIEFLAEDAGVPHLELLPYSGVLCALARFFSLFPGPHPRNRALLSRWFWRGTLTADHQTDNGIDGKKWAALAGDEHDSVQRLLRLLPPLSVDDLPEGLAPLKRIDAARTKIELLALADLEPRLLAGGDAGALVPIAQLYNELDEAKRPLWELVRPGAGERTTAGLLLHPELADRRDIQAASSRDLESHGIDAIARTALAVDDEAAFLEQRARLLGAHLGRFLRERAAISPSDRDRAPLDAYFGEDPS